MHHEAKSEKKPGFFSQSRGGLQAPKYQSNKGTLHGLGLHPWYQGYMAEQVRSTDRYHVWACMTLDLDRRTIYVLSEGEACSQYKCYIMQNMARLGLVTDKTLNHVTGISSSCYRQRGKKIIYTVCKIKTKISLVPNCVSS